MPLAAAAAIRNVPLARIREQLAALIRATATEAPSRNSSHTAAAEEEAPGTTAVAANNTALSSSSVEEGEVDDGKSSGSDDDERAKALAAENQVREAVAAAEILISECFDRLPDERNVPLYIRVCALCDPTTVRRCLDLTEVTIRELREGGLTVKLPTFGGTFLKLLKSHIPPKLSKEIWKEQQKQQALYKFHKRHATAVDKQIDEVRLASSRRPSKRPNLES